MATIEERAKELDELYAKAISREDYQRVWQLSQEIREQFRGQPLAIRTKATLSGSWARYYEVRKFARTESSIDNLYGLIKQLIDAFSPKEIELIVNFKYLLSMIAGELRMDDDEAEKLNREIDHLVKSTDNIPLALKVINAQGLHALREKDWPGAIEAFTASELRFPGASQIPEARQHLANALNNRGLAKLHYSDEGETPDLRKDMIRKAVWDLLAALHLYFMVPLIPQKHLEGIRNRLRLARDKAEEVDPDLVQAIEIFLQ
jgi:hypothetical protein